LRPGEPARPLAADLLDASFTVSENAVLGDSFITEKQAERRRAELDRFHRGRNLTTIVATHGRGDHLPSERAFFWNNFPRARFVAAAKYHSGHERKQTAPELCRSILGNRGFPSQLPRRLVVCGGT